MRRNHESRPVVDQPLTVPTALLPTRRAAEITALQAAHQAEWAKARERAERASHFMATGTLLGLAAMGWADAAAWHFRALGRGATVNVPLRLAIPLVVNALAAAAMAHAIRRSRQCTAKETLPHFLYWLSFRPAAFAVTWIRGLNGAPFSA